MADQPISHRRPTYARYHARQRRRGGRIAALQARIAELEAQAGAYRALQATAPSERLNTLLAVSAALLVTHEIEAIVDNVESTGYATTFLRQMEDVLGLR